MTDCGHLALVASGEGRGLCVLCQQAEIERLLAADKSRVTVHEADIRRLAIECGKAKDDNARLRAALQQIVTEADSDDGLTAWDGAEIARRALENKP